MCYTAIMHFSGNFSKIQFILSNQFFNSVNLIQNNKVLDRRSLDFGKNIGEVSIVVIQFRTQVIGEFNFYRMIGMVNQFDDHNFDFFNQDASFIINQFQSRPA